MAKQNDRGDSPVSGFSLNEEELEAALRPKIFDDFTGQKKIVENLRIFIAAAKNRGEALDHVLLTGPPGLGKTTLSYIISREMGSNIKITSFIGSSGRS